ncbi:beta-1,4-N-acetyl-galactosaminyl transferase 3 [Capsaspora owczarzaki ATCC 30864]|uniref:Beta-1,4-N-acetyl-galactosaminyl transferase 3 n=1 Tax=Capsaspora owczarzaki (strain ATCC 30864) TaxID=595528 RepID=A0A0D2WX99_CAPO3|nr:beta-1,4-N-acetyl-galactosaminyl transferase 3 [Capsaspora owczarzaki ATCC 30864]KJE97765.1 beta-1,4-N-acetyl-galactosaminyl transferase 3 [Capsaspora owczarzaki ATCC 30864]|eukprot:XP_004342953.1 beta-1,4-N-acetyl-galactosaminyl transferase 3 [Capsaspora owczarzaki ATCC 30864]
MNRRLLLRALLGFALISMLIYLLTYAGRPPTDQVVVYYQRPTDAQNQQNQQQQPHHNHNHNHDAEPEGQPEAVPEPGPDPEEPAEEPGSGVVVERPSRGKLIPVKDIPLKPAVSKDRHGSEQPGGAAAGGAHDHQHEASEDKIERAPTPTQSTKGWVNSHIFQGSCGAKVYRGKQSKQFPNFPTVRRKLRSMAANFEDDSYFQRAFGYLVPKTSGRYEFAVASDDTSEFWLSTDFRPRNERLLCYLGRPEDQEGDIWTNPGEYTKYASQISEPVQLEANRPYYMEFFHKQGGGGVHASVAWRSVGQPRFEVIPGDVLMAHHEESSETHSADDGHDHGAASAPPSHSHVGGTPIDSILVPKMDARADFHSVLRVPSSELSSALSTCDYKPSYTVTRQMGRYEGITRVGFSEVFPDDQTQLYDGQRLDGANLVIPAADAQSVVNDYIVRLNQDRADPFTLKQIVNVVRKFDHGRGVTRFLIEVDVTRKSSPGKPERISEYVLRPAGGALCYPRQFAWNKEATVHIVIPVKNQVAWMAHLIENMEELWDETGDNHLNLVIVDYSSTDGDYEAMMRNSRMKSFTFIRKPGNFERAGGLQAGIDSITDPDAIVFTCDLHLEMPATLIDDIRKYTISGKQAYAPLVVRLGCGFTPEKPNGFWERQGYGLFAMAKKDFDRIGGMNTREFGDKWGGEDWEMVDRVMSAGFEVERLRQARFYHFWHSKKGMWSGNTG